MKPGSYLRNSYRISLRLAVAKPEMKIPTPIWTALSLTCCQLDVTVSPEPQVSLTQLFQVRELKSDHVRAPQQPGLLSHPPVGPVKLP